MPQKKNPDLTELLRAKVGRLNGAAQTVALQLKGLPLAYNKDMQETQEPAFSADFVPQMLKLVARFTAALAFNRERMSQAAQSGYLNANCYVLTFPFRSRKLHQRFQLHSGKEAP